MKRGKGRAGRKEIKVRGKRGGKKRDEKEWLKDVERKRERERGEGNERIGGRR